MTVGDCRAGVRESLLRGYVTVVLGTQIRVHADTTDKGTLAFLQTDVGEKICGFRVDGGVVGRGCRSVREGGGDTAGVDKL